MTLRSSHRTREISVETLSPEEAQALHPVRSLYAEKVWRVLALTRVEERVLTFALATIDFVSLQPIGQIEEWLDRADKLVAGQANTAPHAAVESLLAEFFERVPKDHRASARSIRLACPPPHHAARPKVARILARYARPLPEPAPHPNPPP